MNKYRDSFMTQSDSLEEGGRGILTAVENEDTHTTVRQAPPPRFTAKESQSSVASIRTLANDLEESVRTSGASLSGHALETQVAPAPPRRQSAKPQTYEKRQTRSKRSFATLFFLLFAIIVFAGSLIFFAARQGIHLGSINLSFLVPSGFGFGNSGDLDQDAGSVFPETLITVDEQKELPLERVENGGELRSLLREESRNAGQGRVVALSPSQTETDSEGARTHTFTDITPIVSTLDLGIAQTLSRNVTEYTFGVLGGDTAGAFLVARVRSYEQVYGALLSWEQDMAKDLYNSFHTNLASTFREEDAFVDITVLGNDARVLRTHEMQEDGEAGGTAVDVLAYTFIDKDTLVLAGSESDLLLLISRLR